MATKAGFKTNVFKKTLDLLEENVEVGLSEYEGVVEEYLKRVDGSSFLDVFQLKPGIAGFSFDIKMVIEKYRKWRKK